MVISASKSNGYKIGLWVDLTKTSRYYDKEIVEKFGISYLKLECEGSEGAPTNNQVQTFIGVCKNFILKQPLSVIAIHCTHGFNRTGFLICAYLVEALDWDISAAVTKFSQCRQPGIYKQEYIDELFKRYGDVEDTLKAPLRPDWCYEDEDVDDDGHPSKFQDRPETSNNHQIINKRSKFMEGIPGIEFLSDSKETKRLQKKVQNICDFQLKGFPGSQPVSMSHKNKNLIAEKPYEVSWKADGTRYLMLIEDEKEIYFFDRDNSVFKIMDGFPKFLKKYQLNTHLKDTLLDGEMVSFIN